ncbi:LuxR C-terminal-related transcriptional regulator [Magnetospirillum molischianum]|uniref:Two-component response transcriptional regulatory protein sgaR (LuxR family) n=1 Tax=Magnetospirillum molischianum DSM 120 TaxID=1150626 RepID=H8FNG1_MAGML|nr:response regulator transcription factor [Magnetospirillum molischianum]CCG39899.1 Two-component response transcriptional regulatory protein sgaR (LuxR family) [Magnetospirillum molischianum DSM 120]
MPGHQSRPIAVVIAEKNPLLQSSLVKLLGGDERFTIAGVANDGQRFLELLDKTAFRVGVIGWEMPVIDGRGVLQSLRGRTDAPRLIVYTGSANPDVPRQAMTLGAAGFCSKREPPEQLVDTILAVATGRMVFPFIDVASLASDPLAGLTPRERELLAALAGGLTNQQMATQLDISLNTVKFHLKNLYDKLAVGNRAQAVAFFLKGREPR